MPISRLRLRLAAWFGAAFVLGLLVLDVGFLSYARRKAERKLTRDVSTAAADLSAAIRKERSAQPAIPVDSAVQEVLDEWPVNVDVMVILDQTGRRLGATGAKPLVDRVMRASLAEGGLGIVDLPLDQEGELRAAWVRDRGPARITVITGRSTADMREEEEALTGWLLLSLPLIGLGATAAGYALARRALRPVQGMAQTLDAIDPAQIDRRLPVGSPPDELDHLAARFNELLDRLAGAREVSRQFLARAAHQLRTPLTIVRGESALGLERPRTADDYRAALRRVNFAAEQMTRRVEDLFLLAEAEAGERPALTDQVELDGLVMEAVDLMRGRASTLGRALEFGQVEEASVVGAQSLLHEAVVELLENACRHGTADQPVRIGVRVEGARAIVEVANTGPDIPDAPASGLGLSILRWVMDVHGGRLMIQRQGSVNTVILELPAS